MQKLNFKFILHCGSEWYSYVAGILIFRALLIFYTVCHLFISILIYCNTCLDLIIFLQSYPISLLQFLDLPLLYSLSVGTHSPSVISYVQIICTYFRSRQLFSNPYIHISLTVLFLNLSNFRQFPILSYMLSHFVQRMIMICNYDFQ